jgi:penicillin-binding protein 1A
MAIKKNNNQIQNSDKNIAYYQRNFGKFFSMEWVLLVCFLIRFMGTFGSMPSFEDLENQTLTLQPKSFRQMVWF